MRALLLPLAPGRGLAHTGSCLSIGAELARRGHEVVLGYGGEAREVVHAPGVRVVDAAEVPAERERSLRFGDLFPSAEDLEARVRADASLIDAHDPAIVVADTRPPAGIAADWRGRPFLAVHQAAALGGLVPGARRRARARALRAPRHALLRALPDTVRAQGEARAARALEARIALVRARLGVPGAGALITGEHVAVATTPLLDPGIALPEGWRCTGPVTWSAPGPGVPERLRGTGPLVVLGFGSIPHAAWLREAVRALAREPVRLLTATAGTLAPADLEALAPNVTALPVLDMGAALAAADAAVIHGGHLTASLAHRTATPVVLCSFGRDHWLWAERVERLGSGVALRAPFGPRALRRALRRVTGDPAYAAGAAAVARHLRAWDGAVRAADMAEEIAA